MNLYMYQVNLSAIYFLNPVNPINVLSESIWGSENMRSYTEISLFLLAAER